MSAIHTHDGGGDNWRKMYCDLISMFFIRDIRKSAIYNDAIIFCNVTLKIQNKTQIQEKFGKATTVFLMSPASNLFLRAQLPVKIRVLSNMYTCRHTNKLTIYINVHTPCMCLIHTCTNTIYIMYSVHINI